MAQSTMLAIAYSLDPDPYDGPRCAAVFDRLVELGLAKELIGRSTFRLGPDHAWTLAMSCNPGGRLGVADCSAIAGCQP